MFEVQVFIPEYNNDGIAFTVEQHEAFEAFVIGLFGGVSRYPSTVAGAWVSENKIYRDHNRVYGIAVNSIAQGALIAQVVEFAKTNYTQLSIAVRYLGQFEII